MMDGIYRNEVPKILSFSVTAQKHCEVFLGDCEVIYNVTDKRGIYKTNLFGNNNEK